MTVVAKAILFSDVVPIVLFDIVTAFAEAPPASQIPLNSVLFTVNVLIKLLFIVIELEDPL